MLKRIIDKFMIKVNPIRYWRKKGAIIGEGCVIFSSSSLGGEPYLVRIGDNVRITNNVVFITHDGGVWVLRHIDESLKDIDVFGTIIIGNNVHIGNNAIIMPNVHIGSNVIIGCGAVVTHDVPDNSIAVGVPARIVESIDEYEEKNEHRFLHTKNMKFREKKKFVLRHFKNR